MFKLLRIYLIGIFFYLDLFALSRVVLGLELGTSIHFPVDVCGLLLYVILILMNN